MTNGYGAGAMAFASDKVHTNQEVQDCLLPMGITSENVAASYNITRATQDAFSARSFQKAAAAHKIGKSKAEIVPIRAKWVDPKTEGGVGRLGRWCYTREFGEAEACFQEGWYHTW
jgi:acetyl-CoA acyltransferase 1